MDNWSFFEADINRNDSLQYEFKEIIFDTVDKLFCLVRKLDMGAKAKYLCLSEAIKIEGEIIKALWRLEENINSKIEKEFFFDPNH